MAIRLFLVFMLLGISIQGMSQELKWALPTTQYAKFYVSWLVSDIHFDNNGLREDNIVEYGFYGIGVYLESKWSKRFITAFHIPVNTVYTELTPNVRNRSTSIFGDIDVGASYHIIKDSLFLLTGSVILGIPARKHEFTAIMTSDNEFNQLVKLDAAQKFGFGKTSGIFSLYAGYNQRSLRYSEELQYGARASVVISNNDLGLTLYLDGIKSLGSDSNAKYINPTSLFSNFKEYLRLTPEINYYFNSNWGIVLSTSLHVSGRNFVADPMYSVGIIRKKVLR